MFDFRDYFLNNDDEMEALIIDYLKNQKKKRERIRAANQSPGQGWPFYRDVEIPGFTTRYDKERADD
jgi:hypothetical protein